MCVYFPLSINIYRGLLGYIYVYKSLRYILVLTSRINEAKKLEVARYSM